jgi:uroporphyrinogen decarboxylase
MDAVALEQAVRDHPILFPGFDGRPKELDFAPWRRRGVRHRDSWGCVWETNQDGMTGAVVERSLPDWSLLESFRPPDSGLHNGWQEIEWNTIEANLSEARRTGRLTQGSLRHGHTFLTMEFMRGFENLVYDMCDERQEFETLVRMVEEFNAGIVERYLEIGVDIMGYPEDLGSGNQVLISPDLFRRWIKPVYTRLMRPARSRNVLVHMHSDGHIMEIVDDLVDCGVDIINLQDLVNGVDNIAREIKGRMAVSLDIDRQQIVRFGTPRDIDDHIRAVVDKLNDPAGGLSLHHGLYPGIPIENATALMNAMEHYSVIS